MQTVPRTAFLGILLLPMLGDCRCHLDQPGTVLGNFQKVRRGKILAAICRRAAPNP